MEMDSSHVELWHDFCRSFVSNWYCHVVSTSRGWFDVLTPRCCELCCDWVTLLPPIQVIQVILSFNAFKTAYVCRLMQISADWSDWSGDQDAPPLSLSSLSSISRIVRRTDKKNRSSKSFKSSKSPKSSKSQYLDNPPLCKTIARNPKQQ